ncbi:hypothetical protein LTR37_009666 [Vermiconidia calcicola]|uniref:Uncharacterized protein n=1 Tax=Vermiconidia calcicola TaxID=1690605 RepID=A0ACC3N7F5_9PEZI|nr:hypothetical protein LTR37_009666 [Vermiconidia calcicola]
MPPNDQENKPAKAELLKKKDEKTETANGKQDGKKCDRKAEDLNLWDYVEVKKKGTTTLKMIRSKAPGATYFVEETFTGIRDPDDLYEYVSRSHITTGKRKEALEEALAEDGHEDFVVV